MSAWRYKWCMACMNTWGRGGGQRPSTAVLLLALLLLALLLGFVQQHLQLGRGASWGETPHPPPSAALGPLRGAAAQANKAPGAPSPCIYSEPIVLPQVRALALSEAAPRPAISQISPTQKQLRGVGPKLPVVPRPRTTPRPHPCARDTTGGAHPRTCPCGTQPGVSITIIKWVR